MQEKGLIPILVEELWGINPWLLIVPALWLAWKIFYFFTVGKDEIKSEPEAVYRDLTPEEEEAYEKEQQRKDELETAAAVLYLLEEKEKQHRNVKCCECRYSQIVQEGDCFYSRCPYRFDIDEHEGRWERYCKDYKSIW